MTVSVICRQQTATNFKAPDRAFYLKAGDSLHERRPVRRRLRIRNNYVERTYILELVKMPADERKKKNADLLSEYMTADENKKRKIEAELVRINLPLVISIAKKHNFRWIGVEFDDLIMEGSMGLLRAIQKWDPVKAAEKGAKELSTYATWWIRSKIQHFLSGKMKLIHIPAHITDALKRMYRAEEEIKQDGQKPTIELLANKLELKLSEVARLRRIKSIITYSMDSKLKAGASSKDKAVGDTIGDTRPNAAALAELTCVREKIVDIIEQKVKRKRTKILLVKRMDFVFGIAKAGTLEELATDEGVKRERIRQIICQSLARGLDLALENAGFVNWDRIFNISRESVASLKKKIQSHLSSNLLPILSSEDLQKVDMSTNPYRHSDTDCGSKLIESYATPKWKTLLVDSLQGLRMHDLILKYSYDPEKYRTITNNLNYAIKKILRQAKANGEDVPDLMAIRVHNRKARARMARENSNGQ